MTTFIPLFWLLCTCLWRLLRNERNYTFTMRDEVTSIDFIFIFIFISWQWIRRTTVTSRLVVCCSCGKIHVDFEKGSAIRLQQSNNLNPAASFKASSQFPHTTNSCLSPILRIRSRPRRGLGLSRSTSTRLEKRWNMEITSNSRHSQFIDWRYSKGGALWNIKPGTFEEDV